MSLVIVRYWLWNKRQKAIGKELGCKCIRTNPDEENFNERKAISEIYRHIKKSVKKYFIGNILKRLLELQFKPNLKYMFPTIQKHENLFFKLKKGSNDSHK